MWHSRFPEPDIQLKTMLEIVTVSRLDNDRIEIGVARLQHDSNPFHNYPSEKKQKSTSGHLRFRDQRRDNTFSPQIPGTDWCKRTIKVPSDGCSAKRDKASEGWLLGRGATHFWSPARVASNRVNLASEQPHHCLRKVVSKEKPPFWSRTALNEVLRFT